VLSMSSKRGMVLAIGSKSRPLRNTSGKSRAMVVAFRSQYIYGMDEESHIPRIG
jgi:hypothetical protein